MRIWPCTGTIQQASTDAENLLPFWMREQGKKPVIVFYGCLDSPFLLPGQLVAGEFSDSFRSRLFADKALSHGSCRVIEHCAELYGERVEGPAGEGEVWVVDQKKVRIVQKET